MKKDKIENLVDSIVRDITKVSSIPKSEVRSRITSLLQEQKETVVKGLTALKDWEPHTGVVDCAVRDSRNETLAAALTFVREQV